MYIAPWYVESIIIRLRGDGCREAATLGLYHSCTYVCIVHMYVRKSDQ